MSARYQIILEFWKYSKSKVTHILLYIIVVLNFASSRSLTYKEKNKKNKKNKGNQKYYIAIITTV